MPTRNSLRCVFACALARLALLACVTLAGCDLITGPDDDGDSGPIIYFRLVPESGWHLFRTTAGGATPTVLDMGSRTGLFPALSPDGSRLAFVSETEPYGIYVARADGSNPVLAHSPPHATHITWSPDGARLAFESGGEIIIVGADGSNPEVLTAFIPGAVDHPSWSRNGLIAFSLGYEALYTIDPETGDVEPIGPTDAGEVRDPAWSPDGRRLAFVLNNAIHIMNADGSNVRRVIPSSPQFAGTQLGPEWSPSGRWLAFQRAWRPCGDFNCDERGDIHIVKPDGSSLRNLTEGSPWGGVRPTW